MELSAGIVGLPNVGKSTLFNALSRAEVDAANYPFCTIDPNTAVVRVPDRRLGEIVQYFETDEVVPATVEVHDIAGLVEGASEGEGLGNEFLRNIREVEALVHVVRCFDDPDIAHVEGSVGPGRDVETVETELAPADLETVEEELSRARGAQKVGDPDAEKRVRALERIGEALDEGNPARSVDLGRAEAEAVAGIDLLTDKPVLYVANVAEEALAEGSEAAAALRELAERRGGRFLGICAAIEEELAELEPEARGAMLGELGIEEPALRALIREIYDLLGLHSYFTAGPVEIRAWAIPKGATAADAAKAIHSDFEESFIRAEVYRLEELREYGSVEALREAGELRLEGRDYEVRDGDIMYFRHDA